MAIVGKISQLDPIDPDSKSALNDFESINLQIYHVIIIKASVLTTFRRNDKMAKM